MNVLKMFLISLGRPLPQLAEEGAILQFRSAEPDGQAGAMADIERVTRPSGDVVIVSVWTWQDVGFGHSKERIARLTFDASTGELTDEEHVGQLDAASQMIGGMALMDAYETAMED
jgi:hypothetical protein